MMSVHKGAPTLVCGLLLLGDEKREGRHKEIGYVGHKGICLLAGVPGFSTDGGWFGGQLKWG